MSRDGEYLIAGSENGVVTVIRCLNLKILYNYPPCDSPVRSIALAQNH
uniref:Uncharacterized protein n=1 Tax=Romanomermis culicivorax TaxID=13658 RepID=A0A915KWS2_ROMCU